MVLMNESLDMVPLPDKVSKEESSTPDQSGSVRLFPLSTRQRQSIVHMTLAVQNGLETYHLQFFSKLKCDSAYFHIHILT